MRSVLTSRTVVIKFLVVAALAALLGYIAFTFLQRLGFISETIDLQASGESGNPGATRHFKMVTVLPKDAIRAITAPVFLQGGAGDAQMTPQELVVGVETDGEAHAYPINLLSRHEIVNDVVGGRPIAVTW